MNETTSAVHSLAIDYSDGDPEMRAALDAEQFEDEDDWRVPGIPAVTSRCFCIVRFFAYLERFGISLDGEPPDLPEGFHPMPDWQWENAMRRGDADYTYFAAGKVTGLIKIGRSKQPDYRISTLRYGRTGEPAKKLIAIRDGGLEWKYHALFDRWRVYGEWFAPHPSIRAEIARLRLAAGEGANHG